MIVATRKNIQEEKKCKNSQKHCSHRACSSSFLISNQHQNVAETQGQKNVRALHSSAAQCAQAIGIVSVHTNLSGKGASMCLVARGTSPGNFMQDMIRVAVHAIEKPSQGQYPV